MVPNRAGKSPAPQWETLQDHATTDSSEVEDGRYDVPPHRMAPKPALKRKEGDRPLQTNSAKRPRVEQDNGSTRQPDKPGPSRIPSGGSAAGVAGASVARATDPPKASAGHVKSNSLSSKPHRDMILGRASISVPVAGGSTSATQPLPFKARPIKLPSHTQPSIRPRPRLSQAVPNSMKPAFHAPPPTDAEIIDISSGDEAPAPRVQPPKKPKRLILNNAFKKQLGKPESASAPVKGKRRSTPEVIEILDSDEEEEVRRKAASSKGGASGSTSTNAATAAAKGKARYTESSDASMASGSDLPAPSPRSRMNAKGKARAVSSDADSDASMAYAPASAPTSRSSSPSDVLPPLSAKPPVPPSATAPISTAVPIPPSPARILVNASKIEPATPQRQSSASDFVSRPVTTPQSRPVSAFGSPSRPAASGSAVTSTSTSDSLPKANTVSAPESSRYTPIKKPTLGIRAGVGADAGVGVDTSAGSQQRRQLAVKSTALSRLPVSVPLARKTGSRHMVVSDSEGSGSGSHSSRQSHNVVPDAHSRHLLSHSGAGSAQTASDAETDPDTRGLSDALGLIHQQKVLPASHTDSEKGSSDKGKGKEKEIERKRPPLPGRGSTHSRTASASSSVLRTATATGHAGLSVSNANPVAPSLSLVAPQAPIAARVTDTPVTASASTTSRVYKPPHVPPPPKERKVATPGGSDEALPEESEGLSSDVGYETVIRGSQLILNKLAQLRKEKAATSVPVAASSPSTVTATSKRPPSRVVSPEEQEQPTTSPPPFSPTPPLQTSSASTPAEGSPQSLPMAPRPSLAEMHPRSAPSQSSVVPSTGTSVITSITGPSKTARPEGYRVPLPSKNLRLHSIGSIPRFSLMASPTRASIKALLNPSEGLEIRSPGTKPIWPPPPPSEPPSPLDQGPVTGLEASNMPGDVHMITDDETDAARVPADEASESDRGVLIGVGQSEELDQSEAEELQEMEEVQQEVAEMSQSLAAASLSAPASGEDDDYEIPEADDRGEGPSRLITRSSSASSSMHERMPPTPSSDENPNALVETASDGYTNSAEDLGLTASRRPQGKTYGGFPVLTWKEFRKDLRNFTPECLYAKDIPRALHDHVNRLTAHTRMLPAMRALYEAMIQENTAADEPDAPPVRIENPVDEEPTPAWEFYYTNKIFHGEGVPPPDIRTMVNCGCRGPCNPKSSTCACVKRQREAYGYQLKPLNFAYDKAGNLLHPGYPIYECNDLCGCGDECMNRVVQHGRKVGVAIRKTPNKGWGIFATQKIASGQFIGIYSGELLTDHVAHERGVKYNKWGKTYLFDIDFHHLKDPNDSNWTNKFTVDAYHCGNFTRFLNHSCDPNSRLYPCYINEGNIQKPLLAIFSRRVIEADEEVCFNYHGSYPGDDDDDDDGEDEEPITEREAKERDLIYEQCMCGAKNCTGVMFK